MGYLDGLGDVYLKEAAKRAAIGAVIGGGGGFIIGKKSTSGLVIGAIIGAIAYPIVSWKIEEMQSVQSRKNSPRLGDFTPTMV